MTGIAPHELAHLLSLVKRPLVHQRGVLARIEGHLMVPLEFGTPLIASVVGHHAGVENACQDVAHRVLGEATGPPSRPFTLRAQWKLGAIRQCVMCSIQLLGDIAGRELAARIPLALELKKIDNPEVRRRVCAAVLRLVCEMFTAPGTDQMPRDGTTAE